MGAIKTWYENFFVSKIQIKIIVYYYFDVRNLKILFDWGVKRLKEFSWDEVNNISSLTRTCLPAGRFYLCVLINTKPVEHVGVV